MKRFSTLLVTALAAVALCAPRMMAQDANVLTATFDFSAMDPETTPTSNNGHDGDILEDLVMIDGDITMTVSPNPNGADNLNNYNRFWLYQNKIQLRMYGGTITFVCTTGDITQLTISKAQWNANNNVDDEPLEGVNQTTAPRYWYGEQPTVVLNVVGNSQFNKIEVNYVKSAATAINDISTDNVVSERYYDLQGRIVDASARGLLIRQTISADGKVATNKVIR